MHWIRRPGAAWAVPLTAFAAACSQPAAPSITPPTSNLDEACEAATPLRLAVGGVAPYYGANGATLCLDGGTAGAEYLIVASNAATTATARIPLRATAVGVEPPQSALTAAADRAAALQGPTAFDAHTHDDGGFHLRLRTLEREQLTPLMQDARALLQAQRADAAIAAAAPDIGTLLDLNVNAKAACTNPDMRTGRVVAVTQRAVMVADTANPANGFSTADYRSIGEAFDTLVAPVVNGAFGAVTDIDNNGRVLLFYTRAVNEMTPRGSDFVTGGFVFARDLYPRNASPGSPQGCAGSNVAEMFYMLAPDPSGSVNGNARTVEYVRRTTVATLAHEYQHLINAGRRLYETRASSFEAVWLDEGLAHIAEELVFRRAAGLSGGENLGGPDITQSQRRVDAFNRFQSANIGRAERFLASPEGSSPLATNDSLTTRGAVWHMLRYAADRRGGDELARWRSMAGGPAVGTANLAAAFGSDLQQLLVNWHVTAAVDDAVANVPAANTLASWNLRSIFAALNRAYPLRVRTMSDDVPLDASLAGGGAAYFRIRVPADRVAALRVQRSDGAALPTSYVTSVVRTR